MAGNDDHDPKLPTYQDAHDEIDQFAGCVRFELWSWLLAVVTAGMLALFLFR